MFKYTKIYRMHIIYRKRKMFKIKYITFKECYETDLYFVLSFFLKNFNFHKYLQFYYNNKTK